MQHTREKDALARIVDFFDGRGAHWAATALLLTRCVILGAVVSTAAWYLANWLL
jgi:hypothetical protein